MIRPIITTFVLIAAFAFNSANAQQPASYKGFSSFRNVAPGVDFFASNRQSVAAYEKPATEAISKLKNLLGADLPKGAIFICSTLAQKDSIYEPKVLKMGYGWTLTAVTSAVRSQQMLERIKSRMGGQIPAELLDRMKSMPADMTATMEKQTVTSVTQQIAYAVLQSMLAEGLQYRSSRLDDMGKSPLPDWLDIGIAAYASGSNPALAFLQQNMEQTFPLEDVLSMARPFVATTSDQGGGGGMPGGGPPMMGGGPGGAQRGGVPSFGGGGMPGGGQGGAGGARGGPQRTLPKDEQDRMIFDGQASSFFDFMLEKTGIEKMKELVKQAREGKESREHISKPDVLGSDFEKIEADWIAWVKAQKAADPIRRN